jgi:hypothetical protein
MAKRPVKAAKYKLVPIFYSERNYCTSKNPENIRFVFKDSKSIRKIVGGVEEWLPEELRNKLAVLFRTYYITKKTKRAKVILNNYLIANIYKYPNGYYLEVRSTVSKTFNPYVIQPRLYSDMDDMIHELVTNIDWRLGCAKYLPE